MARIEIGVRGWLLLSVLLVLEAGLIFLIGWHCGVTWGSQSKAQSKALAGTNTGAGTGTRDGAIPALDLAGQDEQEAQRPPQFAVHLGSFVIESELEPFVETLQARTWPFFVERTVNTSGNSLFEVRLGRFDDQREAQSWLATATDAGYDNPWVLRVGDPGGATGSLDGAPVTPAEASAVATSSPSE